MEYGGIPLWGEFRFANRVASTQIRQLTSKAKGGNLMINSKKLRQLLAATVFAASLFSVSSVHAASYNVTQGDSLYLIGKMFNTNAATLQQTNNLSSAIIYPGQALTVPGTIYTVKSGDSLYLIAKTYNLSIDLLRKVNNKWDNMIYPGQTLLLPKVAISPVIVGTRTPTAGTSVSATDIDLLSRLITAEASGESYTAQVAVGAVVMNRVKSISFPNTISSVINQKDSNYYQFTPVQNGYINKAATADAIKAAKEAISGVDPTKGAIYYFDDSATNKWLWSRPLALRIGKMVYTY